MTYAGQDQLFDVLGVNRVANEIAPNGCWYHVVFTSLNDGNAASEGLDRREDLGSSPTLMVAQNLGESRAKGDIECRRVVRGADNGDKSRNSMRRLPPQDAPQSHRSCSHRQPRAAHRRQHSLTRGKLPSIALQASQEFWRYCHRVPKNRWQRSQHLASQAQGANATNAHDCCYRRHEGTSTAFFRSPKYGLRPGFRFLPQLRKCLLNACAAHEPLSRLPFNATSVIRLRPKIAMA
ncbi:hypothetical protein ACUXQ2_005924 [Cupriavidus metallidurans]